MANTTGNFSKNITIQSNIKNHRNNDLLNYALFLGGPNVTHDVLANYDPLRTGYGRIFMVRKPLFLVDTIPDQFAKFKHIVEYGNTSVNGIGDIEQQTNQMTVGYVGKNIDLPSFAQDNTNQITIKMYEFSGSPIREVVYSWINGMNDILTGFTHYNGDDEIDALQSNQTAEFIYVTTDNTGRKVEYACMFANCFPKNVKEDQFNYDQGQHNLVEYDLEFSCVKYESLQINKVAQALIDRYRILTNSLNFYSGISIDDQSLGKGRYYNVKDGTFKEDNPQTMTNSPTTIYNS